MITTTNIKKYILPNLPYAGIGWPANKVSESYRLADGELVAHQIVNAMNNLNANITNPIPSFNTTDMIVGVGVTALVYGYLQCKKKNAKNWQHDVEYGSARWGNSKDIVHYVDPNPDNNLLLTATESLTMNSRPSKPKYARNKNVLVIGGSGSGKTRFFVKSNIMQCVSETYKQSVVCTDPKGSLVFETASLLKRKGYKIKVLNTIDMKNSMKYNMFKYIRRESDILKTITALMENTQDGDKKGGDPFWEKAESLLYQALIGYIHYQSPDEDKNINTLVNYINSMKVSENDENQKNAVDVMFEELEFGNPAKGKEPQPDHFAVRQYAKFRLAAGVV